jgi:acetate---CoA ligase (ADP-forming)
MSEMNTAIDLSQYRGEEILKGGKRVLLRAIERSDVPLWLAFVSRMSEETRYFRFHVTSREMTDQDAIRYCTVDYQNSFAYVAEIGTKQDRKIIGIARYYRLPNQRSAELAFAVEDRYQQTGLATRLIEALVGVARDNDISSFEADVLGEASYMIEALLDYGFHVSNEMQAGQYHVTFSIKPTQAMDLREVDRDRDAIVASLQPILRPKSVAIIGAARNQGTIGNLLMRCILQSGYSGVVYPVNPNADAVLSVKSYPSVLEIPGNVDMAIIAVPAAVVSRVVDECGRKGVRALIVISDGFRERGGEGIAREEQLKNITLSYGMRLIGPNCMGVINTDPDVSMNASFSHVFPIQGNVAFLSQSGAMGLTILEHAKNLNMGLSSFVSIGNRADVSFTDLLLYWDQDPATKVILLYIESFGDPGKFARIARRVSAKKPIVAVKGGTTAAGARAASSHTGAMASSNVASEVLFHNAGIIRVTSVEELFDLGTLLSTQPLPRGRRLAIVTNGGGPGILAADAASLNGLEVPELSAETREKIRPALKRDVSLGNPMDTTAGATAEEYEGILKVLAADDNIDAVLTIFVPPIVVETKTMEDTLSRMAPVFWRAKKPLLGCFIGQKGLSSQLGTQGHFIPLYTFPEEAILSLRRAVEYAELKSKPAGAVPMMKDIRRLDARKLINSVMKNSHQRPLQLSAEHISELLSYYGILQAEIVLARSSAEAKAAAKKLGFPVAVKLASPTITHKTDVGGVVLDVRTDKGVEEAFRAIRENLRKLGRESEMSGVTLQHMVTGGIETIVGVTQDPSFGPLIMFGSGGVYAELIKDVVFKLHPITDLDAAEMITSLKMSKLFEGYRGAPPSDVKAIQELLLRISALVEDVPEISELDLNPVNVRPSGEGYWVLDARIMVK